jgi:diguanylate cyclase (GGDEF)-like protein
MSEPDQTNPPNSGRTPASLRRGLVVFAAAAIVPIFVGALISGGLLFDSSKHANDLAEELREESGATLNLTQSLQAARLTGSGYMEDGDGEDLRAFDGAVRRVNRGLASTAYDDPDELDGLEAVKADWRASVRQLRTTPTGVGSATDDASDPEDVFEDHVNEALIGVEELSKRSDAEIGAELSRARDLWRLQVFVALAALVAALGIAALLVRRISAAMLRPIDRLIAAARAFGEGRLDHRVQVGSSVELKEMADTFNHMAGALEEQHDQLERQAFTDRLTGLPNRSLFEDRTQHALEGAAGSANRVAVLVLDLDDFKVVNDALGHASGDLLIAEAGRRIRDVLRPSDTVARVAGDGFAILLERIRGLDDALGAAERVQRVFEAPFHMSGSDLLVTASVGIAVSAESVTANDLLRRGDLALHRAKQRGKNTSAFFDAAMDQHAGDRLEVLNALRGAVARGELVAHYQPVVRLEDGEVIGAEALLRWARPGHDGLVPPLDFIPLAEETGLITELGEWILYEACEQAQAWRDDGAPSVSVGVNVSARQLLDPNFERMVDGALSAAGLEPTALILEITESSVMHNPEVTIAKLDRLAKLGIPIVLDDFGEGYSSLSQVRRLPIKGMKIARPFIKELGHAGGDPALVRGIIELADSLGLHMVAEGIEEAAQHEQLLELGCPNGQGFLYARPLEISAFRAQLHERSAHLA